MPTGFDAEMTRNNVLLTDTGDMTAPITLPGLPENLALVKHSNRADAYYKPLTDLDVMVNDGLMNRSCNLGIHSADEEDGISATIYLATGDFYSRIGNTRLNWLGWPVYHHQEWSLQNMHVQYLIDMLKLEYDTPTDAAIFSVRPVATTQDTTWIMPVTGEEIPGLFILNGFEKVQHVLDFSIDGTEYLNRFQGEFTQQIKGTDSVNAIAIGYGMTPFLKLRFMMDFIFGKFGYTTDMSFVTSIIPDYSNRIVCLNNVADAIYSGSLDFKQLVPDVTIKEFITQIEKFLGGKFVINEVTKIATFYRFEKQLTEVPEIDLTKYLSSKPKLGSTEFTTIKINDSADSSTTSSDTQESATTIDFDFVKEVLIKDWYLNTDNERVDCVIGMVTVDGVINVKSQIVVPDKTITTEKPATSSLIQLMNVANGWETKGVGDAQNHIWYMNFKRSFRLFTGMGVSTKETVDSFYMAYKDFRKNSNIPQTAEMNIPTPVLDNLILPAPVLLNNQPVMIESIKYSMGKRDKQTVGVRTLRPFFERTPNP